MKLNSRGERCGGVGGTTVTYEGRPIASPAGGANWMDDDHIVYQVCDAAGCRVERYNVRTGAKDVPEAFTVPSPDGKRIPFGANFIEAGGGLAAVWFGTSDPNSAGITLSDGRRFPIAGLGTVSPDGAVAIKDDYQSSGPWHVHERDGSSWLLSAGDAFAINLLGSRRALFAGPAGWTGINIPTPKVLPGPAWWMRAIEIAGEWWVLYQHEDGSLVLHPFTSTLGYRLAPAGSLTYRPDIVVLHDKLVRVVWASREDEGTDVQHVVDHDITTIRVELATPVVVPPPPPPPPPDDKKDKPVPTSNHLEDVKRIRAKYDTPLGARHWQFLVELAQVIGARLFRKDGGTNILIPALNLRVSQDIIVMPNGEGFDVLGDGEGAATPGWDSKGQMVGEFVDVSGVKLSDSPVVVVDGGGTQPQASTFASAAASIEARIASIAAAVDALKSVVNELKQRPILKPEAVNLDGVKIALRTDNGHFLSAQDGGGGVVHTQRPEPGQPVEGYTPGGWETFTVVAR
jgi:hypothetical protein